MIVPASPSETFDKYDEPRLHMEKLLSEHLVNFDINIRTLCSLERAGITRLGQLVRLTRAQLMHIRRLGVVSVNEIEAKMKWLGLSLGMK